MNASSESGLWATVISRTWGITDEDDIPRILTVFLGSVDGHGRRNLPPDLTRHQQSHAPAESRPAFFLARHQNGANASADATTTLRPPGESRSETIPEIQTVFSFSSVKHSRPFVRPRLQKPLNAYGEWLSMLLLFS